MIDDVIVIVVNWNREADTIECIQSVLKSDYPVLKVLLIDNGSKENIYHNIKEKFPQIETIRLSKNLGFAKAYNIGFEYSLRNFYKYIFILNDDTVIHPSAISELIKSASDIAVPKILFYDNPNLIWSAGAEWKMIPPRIVMRGYKKHDINKYNLSRNLKYATACAMLIHRDVIEKVGGFDEDYINYFEDYDFTCRASRLGFKINYVPQAIVYHKVSLTLGENSSAKWFFLGRNSMMFFRKNRFPLYYRFFYIIWVLIRETLKMNYQSIKPFIRGVLSYSFDKSLGQ
jgi:GT2 family glycosyltransferase